MRWKQLAAIVAASLWICAAGQTEKPSPFHPKPPAGSAKKNGTTPHSKADSGSSDRAAKTPSGPNTGTACFYVPKRDGAMHPLSAAAPSYPIGSRVRVTNLSNRKSVVVTVTDNTAIPDRIISVSSDAADQLGFRKMGSAQVHIQAAELD